MQIALDCIVHPKNGVVLHFHGGPPSRARADVVAVGATACYEGTQTYPVFSGRESVFQTQRNDLKDILQDAVFHEPLKTAGDWFLKEGTGRHPLRWSGRRRGPAARQLRCLPEGAKRRTALCEQSPRPGMKGSEPDENELASQDLVRAAAQPDLRADYGQPCCHGRARLERQAQRGDC